MSLRKVNVLSAPLDASLDDDGFRHDRTSIRGRLGAARIGASVYEGYERKPRGPYHYHHGIEEWLYVIDGAPVLREPVGERVLSPGDLVCFPSGPDGAHTTSGSGRYLVLSTGDHVEPWLTVYPDSGKISVPGGIQRLDSALGYHDGEAVPPARPSVNLGSVPVAATRFPDAPEGFGARALMLGPVIGAERLGATLMELDPGQGTAPYHYHYGREEWLFVISGTPTLRHPAGTDVLDPGDIVCFPEGPEGAHRVINRSSALARVLLLSTMEIPTTAYYPDSGKWFLRNTAADAVILRQGERVDYWDGEAG